MSSKPWPDRGQGPPLQSLAGTKRAECKAYKCKNYYIHATCRSSTVKCIRNIWKHFSKYAAYSFLRSSLGIPITIAGAKRNKQKLMAADQATLDMSATCECLGLFPAQSHSTVLCYVRTSLSLSLVTSLPSPTRALLLAPVASCRLYVQKGHLYEFFLPK